ncbi:hypothetical protein ON010_g1491 [Phytophthora cinnamomi]|nr:hypothetical protein ON010_g1491 [Phytophthora cinnamomi]
MAALARPTAVVLSALRRGLYARRSYGHLSRWRRNDKVFYGGFVQIVTPNHREAVSGQPFTTTLASSGVKRSLVDLTSTLNTSKHPSGNVRRLTLSWTRDHTVTTRTSGQHERNPEQPWLTKVSKRSNRVRQGLEQDSKTEEDGQPASAIRAWNQDPGRLNKDGAVKEKMGQTASNKTVVIDLRSTSPMWKSAPARTEKVLRKMGEGGMMNGERHGRFLREDSAEGWAAARRLSQIRRGISTDPTLDLAPVEGRPQVRLKIGGGKYDRTLIRIGSGRHDISRVRHETEGLAGNHQAPASRATRNTWPPTLAGRRGGRGVQRPHHGRGRRGAGRARPAGGRGRHRAVPHAAQRGARGHRHPHRGAAAGQAAAEPRHRREELPARVPLPAGLRRLHVGRGRPREPAQHGLRAVPAARAVPGRAARGAARGQRRLRGRGLPEVQGRRGAQPDGLHPGPPALLLRGRERDLGQRDHRQLGPERQVPVAGARPGRHGGEDPRGHLQVAPPADSARANLASTFVNALVNAGYGTDKLMTPEGNTWLYKNKKHGMMSAAASLGMIMLWNVEEGITQIDKYLYSGDEYVKAGAILGVGVVSAGIRNDCDPALALLSEHIDSGNCSIRCASCLGLGIAYAGSAREDVSELLIPVVSHADENADIQEVSYAALALGMVEVGTCDDEAGSVLMQRLMESSDAELDSSCARFLALGLGLLYLGRQERVEAMLEAAKTIEHKMSKYLAITLETCAYAGSGNVLKVQQLLRTCAEHIEDPIEAQHQSVAVLGIALITMGENIGSEMAMRSFDHLLQYGEVAVRRAVPLAFALLSVSNPEYALIDTLSRLTHDVDSGVAQNAILALGLVAAGTNNSRVAGLLRQLSEFYSREANHLFVVRIAQGLLHMGKGLMTLHPFHSDRLIMSRVAVSGLLTILHASLDMEHTILDTSHYILYCIATAMQPRMLITLDEELNPLPVSVRVGQAVEIVGQAGRPKSITGFQTHTTPVLLNVKDRAELATEEYLPLTNVLEGVVILRKNPDYEPET